MVLDYSKWDKIELSDDSDIEVHPNVDKRSFIRWKQRDIHEKRAQRDATIIHYRTYEIPMYSNLEKRIKFLLESTEDLSDPRVQTRLLKEADEKFPREEIDRTGAPKVENEVSYLEMTEDLMTQIQDSDEMKKALDSEKLAVFRKLLEDHLSKVIETLQKRKEKLAELEAEKKAHITLEDIHTGFDYSSLNKDAVKPHDKEPSDVELELEQEQKREQKGEQKQGSETKDKVSTPAAKASSTTGKPVSASATSSGSNSASDASSSSTAATSASSNNKSMLDNTDLTMLPATLQFSKIPRGDYRACLKFLTHHKEIATEQQKDALIMTAFDAELDNQHERTLQIVHQALLLQYAAQLGGSEQGITMLFMRLLEPNHPAKKAFLEDVKFTTNHIVNRCKIIREEQAQGHSSEPVEEVEQIQLHPVDANTVIQVSVPDPNDKEVREVYEREIPEEMRKAIETQSLDEINKVLGSMSIAEAEKMLEVFDKCGVLSVEEKVYDMKEWEQKKKELEQQGLSVPPLHQEETEEIKESAESNDYKGTAPAQPFVSSADIVD